MEKAIIMIIDFDGFNINKTFYVREMGITFLNRMEAESYQFDLSEIADNMDQKYWKHVTFCKYNLHGLGIKPSKGEPALTYKCLRRMIQLLYSSNKTTDKYVVGYKGGHVEKDILNELGIPSFNLEDIGCPKIADLPPPTIQDCGYHIIKGPHIHCPKQETWMFAKWYMENVK